jgi:hypothetical protein
MLHKANEACALAGFQSNAHEFTLIDVQGLFNPPELIDALRMPHTEGQNVDYRINPESPDLKEFENPEQFINADAEPFVREIDELIKKL